MHWYAFDTWIVIVGVLSAMACASVGTFLLLRRMSMMGDAISHAVLPGLAAAYLLTGSRASLTMLAGAAIVGVLTAVFTQWVSSFGNVDRGAAMGIVFTSLFALGLILIVRGADRVDLDPGCVLYGAIELTPLDVVWSGSVAGVPIDLPRAAVMLGGVLLVNLLVIAALFKELRISAFDPSLATTLGINATVMHYLLMTLVAITTVASFEAVGSILVIAMLIVPPATARLLTDRLLPMLLIALAVGAASATLGHVGALVVPGWLGFESTVTSGMIAAAAGLLFLLALLLSPGQGILLRRHRVAALNGGHDPG